MKQFDLNVVPLNPADELLLKAAMLPDEERAHVIVDMERMVSLLKELNEILSKPAMRALAAGILHAQEDKSSTPIVQQRPVVGSPLCDTCSVFGACGKKSADVSHCNDWRQFTPKCVGATPSEACAMWDDVACVGSLRCQGGDRYVARKRSTPV